MKEKVVRFIKKNLKWIILFLCVIIFLEIMENVFGNEMMKRDKYGYEFISKYFINDKITPIAKIITQFGSAIVLACLGLVASVYFWKMHSDKKMWFYIFLNLGLIGLINQVLKRIVQRPRPTEYRIIDESGYSFPSGHSMGSMAFYGFLIYLIYKKVQNKKLKWVLIIFLSIFTLLIGVSRIYLGVHYTTDVMAGFLITVSYLTVYTSIIDDYIGTAKK